MRPSESMRFGVLLQGPVVRGYTLDTCRLYRTRWPDARIVLSTWREEAAALEPERGALDALRIERVLSAAPTCAGPQNTNLQITSTRAGLEALGVAGVTHVLKSRTDVRVEADARALLEDLRRRHPTGAAAAQSERLVIAQTYTRTGLPYHASDMVVMGAWTDLQRYFGAPLRAGDDDAFHSWKTLGFRERLFSERGVQARVEQYLCTSYLRRVGWTPRFTIADWHAVLAALFCVVDDQTLGFRWYKNPGRFGGAGRFDSDFVVTKSPLTATSSLLCRRVTHRAWLTMLAGRRPRLDADRREALLPLANAVTLARDAPGWTLSTARRLRRHLTGEARWA